ncbi:hypothetical protein MIR68_003883 [Amoeboaphelidium protococcarum]|nr:hypothetical protein MIR68_003883 [Amoeboaphelidium protococcarum]
MAKAQEKAVVVEEEFLLRLALTQTTVMVFTATDEDQADAKALKDAEAPETKAQYHEATKMAKAQEKAVVVEEEFLLRLALTQTTVMVFTATDEDQADAKALKDAEAPETKAQYHEATKMAKAQEKAVVVEEEFLLRLALTQTTVMAVTATGAMAFWDAAEEAQAQAGETFLLRSQLSLRSLMMIQQFSFILSVPATYQQELLQSRITVTIVKTYSFQYYCNILVQFELRDKEKRIDETYCNSVQDCDTYSPKI